MLVAVAALAFGSGSRPAVAVTGNVTAGQASVIDGDTIEIHGVRIRLFGIDAPEGRQTCQNASGEDYRCGQRAALALSDKLGRRTVSCIERDIDKYHRVVAVCTAGGVDVNGWMVRQGWATAYRRYSEDYVADEEAADAARAGLWAGSFTRPEEWRRAQSREANAWRATPSPSISSGTTSTARVVAVPQDRSGCDIKGNISYNGGQRIYHVPGGKYYAQTRINRPGERWFCSEEEAQAAGWRRSME